MADQDLAKLRIEKAPVSGRPRRRKKRLLLASAVAILLLLGILYWAGIIAPAVPVQVATVTQVYPSQTFTLLNASGYVVAQRKSALASKVTGRLIWLGVEEGSRVKAGDVVAKLESQDVLATRDQARANLNTARYNLDQAKAELTDATLALKRAKELVSRGYIAQSDYDTAVARHRKAVAAVEAGQATVKANTAALEGAEVSLEYTFIRAPFNAIVLTKNADVGDIVTPIGAAANAKSAVVTIADMGSLKVEADVAESNLSRVQVGQPSEIQLDALPGTRFPGKVHMIVPTADRTKATVLVKVGFLEMDPRILPEMSAKVAFLSRPPTGAERTPKTAVNKTAIVSRNGNTVAFVIKEDKVFQTPVTPGEEMGDMVEVRRGLSAGQKVVVTPPSGLRSGSKIKAVEK